MQPKLSKIGGAAVLIGVNLFAVAVLAVAFELVFGSWFDPYVLPNPKKYNRTYTFRQSMYEPAGDITYSRDEFGLRGVRGPIASVGLVTIGGSTTDQPLIGEGQTWQDVIHETTGINVANAGIDGMGSQSIPVNLDEWLHRIPDLRPQYYLYYNGVNDATMSQTVPIAEQQRTYRWSRRVRARSAILQAIASVQTSLSGPVLVNHAAILPTGEAMTKVAIDARAPSIVSYIETMYKPNLRVALAAHKARGESVIFVSQTANPALVAYRSDGVYVSRADIGGWATVLQQINRATADVCNEHAAQCTFIDLAQRIGFVPGDFYDLVHNTPQGARKIGLFLSEELRRLPKFKRVKAAAS